MSKLGNPVRPRGTDGAKIIQVIETKAIKGLGTQNDPVRFVFQYSCGKR